MNFQLFFEQNSSEVLSIGTGNQAKRTEIGNDALFQLPLIALVILVLAKDRRKPKISEIGQVVGESIEACMPGFKGSSQHLGWSATLRIRTVTALNFLDFSGLILAENERGRVQITELGKRVISRAMNNNADDLSYHLARVARAYRNMCVARQLDLSLE